MSMDSLDHVVEQMREESSKMTAETIAEIRQQLTNRGATPCARCKDGGKIAVRNGRAFITDYAEERAACWRDEICPQCGGIAIRAVGLLTELLDELDIDRAPLYTDRIANLERERDAALAGRTDHGTDAEQQVTRFIAEDETTTWQERAEKAERKLGELEFAFDGVELSGARKLRGQIATLTRERDSLIDELESAKVLDAQARTDWEKLTSERDELAKDWRQAKEAANRLANAESRLTHELEAERAGSAAMREALLHSRTLHLGEDEVEYGQRPCKTTQASIVCAECDCGRQQERDLALSSTAGAKMLERLRKAETDRDKFASCWAKAETALNDMEIAKNERITALEAALEETRKALDTIPFDLMWTAGYPYTVNLSDGAFLQLRAAHERIGLLMPEKP